MTHRFDWLGNRAPYLDTPYVMHCGTVIIGCYGGNSRAGARHNEDAALIWQAADRQWTFAAILDAHTTGQSAMLVLNLLNSEHDNLVEALSYPTHGLRAIAQAAAGGLHVAIVPAAMPAD